MYCPYCKHQDHLEIDLHSDGFSTTLLECTNCGALLKTNKTNMETVFGPARMFFANEIIAAQS